jgi:peptide/nickel transport system permease protein
VATDPYAEVLLDKGAPAPGEPAAPPGEKIEGRSPWYLAWRRLRRNRVALGFGALFVLIVVFCLAAPLWAQHVAHTGPNTNHSSDQITINGQPTDVVSDDCLHPTSTSGTAACKPIGPGLHSQFLLGADANGRDVMVRLMYGGRTSIYIGVAAALVTTLFAVLVGLLSGYYRGWTDSVLSRLMDIIWAFPVLLLGIALGTALALGGLKVGPITIAGDSLWIPILIIGFVYVPYMARPIRGEVLALREKEFVEAAVAQGKGPARIMLTELLPNLLSTIIVFFTLNIANNMLLESALSFLGAGVRAPNSSWGTMIEEGYDLIYSAPYLTILPGLMIVLTVLSLNVFGDGLRDALNPRASLRSER